jgi:N-hydroxyarylamine O-acetyltransferase
MGRYLDLLGVTPGESTLGLLRRIVAAQLIRAPFENISKLHAFRVRGADRLPSLEEYLEGIRGSNLGGTCYPNNIHLNSLLVHLGFDAALCGADMSGPDAHVVTMVTVEGRPYLVDVGYGAPFFDPLPLDLETELTVDFGRCRYVLRPADRDGLSRLDMLRDGRRVHGYLAKPKPRSLDHFEAVIRDSFRPEAAFMNTVVIERFEPGRSLRLHGLKLTETAAAGPVSSLALSGADELVEVVERRFGVPAAITRAAVDGLSFDADIYG